MQQGIVKGDVLQRMSSISFLVAFVLTVLGSALYPRASDPTNAKTALDAISNAGTGLYKVVELLLAGGIWAVVIGTAGIYRSLATGVPAVWSRLGFYGILIGGAVWTTVSAIGIGLSQILETWATSSGPDKAQLFLNASSLAQIDNALFSVSIIVIWLALAFLAIGMILGSLHPKWLGWSLLVLGVLTAVVGIAQALTGASVLLTNVLFSALGGLTSVWSLITGISLLRKAW